MPNTYAARQQTRRAAHVDGVAQEDGAAVLGIGIALGACGTPPPLDQAIKCDQFKRSPDGTWTTITDVSLDYVENGTHWQENFSKGVTISASRGGQGAAIVVALKEKCSATK